MTREAMLFYAVVGGALILCVGALVWMQIKAYTERLKSAFYAKKSAMMGDDHG